MRIFTYTLAFGFILISQSAPLLHAMESYVISDISSSSEIRFNNENWFTLPHPTIASFSVREDGSAFGFTNTGVSFSQYNVPNNAGIRIQRFEIQDHYHYILDGVPVYSFEELSAQLVQRTLSTDAT